MTRAISVSSLSQTTVFSVAFSGRSFTTSSCSLCPVTTVISVLLSCISVTSILSPPPTSPPCAFWTTTRHPASLLPALTVMEAIPSFFAVATPSVMETVSSSLEDHSNLSVVFAGSTVTGRVLVSPTVIMKVGSSKMMDVQGISSFSAFSSSSHAGTASRAIAARAEKNLLIILSIMVVSSHEYRQKALWFYSTKALFYTIPSSFARRSISALLRTSIFR